MKRYSRKEFIRIATKACRDDGMAVPEYQALVDHWRSDMSPYFLPIHLRVMKASSELDRQLILALRVAEKEVA